MQSTLASDILLHGIGLHGGKPVTLRLCPAPVGFGIRFCRTDLPGRPMIHALWDRVIRSELCTLVSENDASVSTIEHLMAAFLASGITNALVEIDGPEVPIMDGSSLAFMQAIMHAGMSRQMAEAKQIRILKPVRVSHGDAFAELLPCDDFILDFHIDFSDAAIGRQDFSLSLSTANFMRELADCRTFCRERDVNAMRSRGLALGGTYENAVVFEGGDVLSPGGLRRRNEPVRHKMLDAIGDLALAGAPILGHYRGWKAGHAMTNNLLRSLFSDTSAWRALEHEFA